MVGPKNFDFFHQLNAGGRGYWMAALPPGARGVRLDLTLADGTVVLAGPFDLPGKVFTAVNWVGQGAGYEISPNSFYNGNPGNDFAWKTDKTDEYFHNPLWRANSSAAKPFLAPWIDPPVGSTAMLSRVLWWRSTRRDRPTTLP